MIKMQALQNLLIFVLLTNHFVFWHIRNDISWEMKRRGLEALHSMRTSSAGASGLGLLRRDSVEFFSSTREVYDYSLIMFTFILIGSIILNYVWFASKPLFFRGICERLDSSTWIAQLLCVLKHTLYSTLCTSGVKGFWWKRVFGCQSLLVEKALWCKQLPV